MKNSYVYILTNWNNKAQHKAKIISGFTKRYTVDKLVHFEDFSDITIAIEREKEIEGWRRHKKNVLVEINNPGWIDLSVAWYGDPSGAVRRSG